MNGYLLDSTVLIDIARGQEAVSNWLMENVQRGVAVYVSPITISEYMSGVPERKRQQSLQLLRAYPLLNIDIESAAEAGTFRYVYARKGLTISVPDAIQAALTTRHSLVLATSNSSHFPGIVIVDPRDALNGSS